MNTDNQSLAKRIKLAHDDVFLKTNPSEIMGLELIQKLPLIENYISTGKCFKDSSKIYKMLPFANIDNEFLNIQYQNSYAVCNMSIISDRGPRTALCVQ